MNTEKTNINEGGQDSQNTHNIEAASRSLLHSLEPSLWNSKIGRRAFVKKTGAATVGTAIALHGFRMEVMATESGSEIDWTELTIEQSTEADGLSIHVEGATSAEAAMAQAQMQLAGGILGMLFRGDWTLQNPPNPNPVTQMCNPTGPLESIDVTITPAPDDEVAAEWGAGKMEPVFDEVTQTWTVDWAIAPGPGLVVKIKMDYNYKP